MKYLLRRILAIIPVLLLVSIITFSLIYLLPGDAALAMLGETANDPVAYEALRIKLGLDQPIYVQYYRWISNALMGDFGVSTRNYQPVTEAIVARLGPTIQLTVMSFIWSVVIGIPVGIISAIRPNSWADAVGSFFAVAGVAIPNFWLGVMLILFVGVWLDWLPSMGYVSPSEDLWLNFKLMLMPSFTLSSFLMAVVMRQVRSSLLEVMQQDYIRTARAKGIGYRRVVTRHALKNAMIPVVTVLAYQMGNQLSGAVVVETVFSIPGAGRLAADSIFFRDFPVMTAVVMAAALAALVFNLIADLLYAYLDPRIRYS